MIIEDGTGKGYQVAVNNENKLLVSATSFSIEHYINHKEGRGYNLTFSAIPTSGSDCFLYMKNGDQDRDLCIEGFWFKMAADDYIDFVLEPTGTQLNGTDITPVNLNTRSGYTAVGTFQSGNDITGLSGGNTAMRIFHANSNESIYRNFDQDIFLGYNSALALYIGSGTVQVDGIICFNYHTLTY